MAIATIQEVIDRGNLSVPIAVIDNERGSLFGARLSAPASPRTILMVTDALTWGRDGGAQTDQSIREVANYLVWLCGMYGQRAQFILENGGGGGSVVPGGGGGVTGDLFPLVITDDDMTDGTIYDNPAIVGKNIMLWVSLRGQEWLVAPEFFVYTATGFQIVFPGFDAADYPFIRIDKFNSANSPFSPSTNVTPIVIEWDLVADTLITNPTVPLTTAGQPVIIDIKPNGFNYTWDTLFEFSDTLPEQPGSTGINTRQVYSFTYLPAIPKLVIVSESLNVAI